MKKVGVITFLFLWLWAAPVYAQEPVEIELTLINEQIAVYFSNNLDFNMQNNDSDGLYGGVSISLHGQASRIDANLGTQLGYPNAAAHILQAVTFPVNKTWVQYLVVEEAALGQYDGWLNREAFGFTGDQISTPGVYSRTFTSSSAGLYRWFNIKAENPDIADLDVVNITWEAYTFIVEAGWTWPEPEIDYCPDGIELVAAPLDIPLSGSWNAMTTTSFTRLRTRFIFDDPSPAGYGSNCMGYLEVNEFNETLSDFCHNYGPYTFTVPAEPTFTLGPTASVTYTNNGGTVRLLSACVVNAVGPSELCPDGIEMLDAPLTLYHNSLWTSTLPISMANDMSNAIVRYAWGRDPVELMYPALWSDASFTLEKTRFYQQWGLDEEEWSGSFYLPVTGTLKILDGDLDMSIFNDGYVPAVFNSVCVLDARRYLTTTLTTDMCHLVNPDFIRDPFAGSAGGWGEIGTPAWSKLIGENGGLTLTDSAGAVQGARIDRGQLLKMQVRARAIGGVETLAFGSSSENMLSNGPQIYTTTLPTQFSLVEEDVYIGHGQIENGSVFVNGDDVEVDYVCLTEPDGLFPIVDCEKPDLTGTDIFTWIKLYLPYFLCELTRFIALQFNRLWILLKTLAYWIPPMPGSGSISWLEWAALSFERFLSWIGISTENMKISVRDIAAGIGSWILELINDLLVWLIGQIFGLSPADSQDILNAIWYEFWLFWEAVGREVDMEFATLLELLRNTANILILLFSGFREAISGNDIPSIGEEIAGSEAIWEGVDFLNEVISTTPLVALNIAALGIIGFNLTGWTFKRMGTAMGAL